eukprot:TRINITY_DN39989_c0_g1_i1.p2 TRINITY_DN39989_c0_g1~~TRINITY_DN39989_c0_g1_i1.p2  ORF type:complete len:167 (+),score=38.22 TRINITY_DN39989_c0_g1_i1:2-502(+)
MFDFVFVSCSVLLVVLLCVFVCVFAVWFFSFVFFFSSRRRHTRCREVSWARRCVQETGYAHNGRIYNCSRAPKTISGRQSLNNNWNVRRCFRGNIALCSFQGVQNSIGKADKKNGITKHYSTRTIIPVSYTHLTLPTILLVQISVVAASLKKKTTTNSINQLHEVQ